MNVIIDNFDFWNIEAQKYYSFPSSYDTARRKTEAKGLATSGQYIGSIKHDGVEKLLAIPSLSENTTQSPFITDKMERMVKMEPMAKMVRTDKMALMEKMAQPL